MAMTQEQLDRIESRWVSVREAGPATPQAAVALKDIAALLAEVKRVPRTVPVEMSASVGRRCTDAGLRIVVPYMTLSNAQARMLAAALLAAADEAEAQGAGE